MPVLEELWRQQTDNLVSGIAMSLDGEFLAVGSWDKNTYLYKKNGDLLWKMPANDMVSSVAMSGDGSIIIVGSWDRFIYAYGKSAKLLWKVKADSYVRDVAVSGNGDRIIVGTWSGTFYLLDREGKILWKDKKPGAVLSVGISNTGKVIALGTLDHQIFILNENKEELWRDKVGGYISCLAMSHDGEYVAAGSRDSNIYFYDKGGNKLWKYRTGGLVKDVVMTMYGEFVTAASHENFLFHLERTGKLVWVNRQESELYSLASSEFGSLIGIGTKDSLVYLLRNREAIEAKLTGLHKLIDDARQLKVDVVDAEKEVKAAEKARDADDLTVLLGHIEKATDLLQRSRQSFFRKKAEKKVSELDEAVKAVKDRDTTVINIMLERTRALMEAGKFDRAIRMAEKGMSIVTTLPVTKEGGGVPSVATAKKEEAVEEGEAEVADVKATAKESPAEEGGEAPAPVPSPAPAEAAAHSGPVDEELKNKVSKDIRRLDLILRSKERAGFNIVEAKDLLEQARAMLDGGDLEMASEFVQQAKTSADGAIRGAAPAPALRTVPEEKAAPEPAPQPVAPQPEPEPAPAPQPKAQAPIGPDPSTLTEKGQRILQAIEKLEEKVKEAVEGDKETVMDFLMQARDALSNKDEKTALEFLSQSKTMVTQLKMPPQKKHVKVESAKSEDILKCPKCSKRIKPQWTDCPFCRTKLK